METDPITQEKQRLIHQLETERRQTIAVLQGLDPYLVVHTDSGWRVKDLVGHLAAWDREVLAAMQAFHEGDHYIIPNFTSQGFNEAQYERRRTLDPAQIRMDWGMVRRDVQDMIHDLHAHLFETDMTYPWGERGKVVALIEELASHEAEHRGEIEARLKELQRTE
jgi:hypothetical protein